MDFSSLSIFSFSWNMTTFLAKTFAINSIINDTTINKLGTTFDYGAQTWAALVTFVSTLLITIVPVYFLHWWVSGTPEMNVLLGTPMTKPVCHIGFTKPQVIAFLTQLGGGVLFHTIFMVLMPQLREDYVTHQSRERAQGVENQSQGLFWHLSIDSMICAGFFAIFFIDQLIHLLTPCSHELDITTTKGDHIVLTRYRALGSIRLPPKINTGKESNKCDKQLCKQFFRKNTLPTSALKHEPLPVDTIEVDMSNQMIPPKHPAFRRFLDALLVLMAFGCDAVFDGIAIGAQQNATQIWTMVVGMMSHKLLLSFILSVQLYERFMMEPVLAFEVYEEKQQAPNFIFRKPIKQAIKLMWILSTILASLTPIGIALAQCLSFIDSGHSAATIVADKQFHMLLISAFSAGSMLFVVFIEIMDKTAAREHLHGMIQLLAIVIGFILMEVCTRFIK